MQITLCHTALGPTEWGWQEWSLCVGVPGHHASHTSNTHCVQQKDGTRDGNSEGYPFGPCASPTYNTEIAQQTEGCVFEANHFIYYAYILSHTHIILFLCFIKINTNKNIHAFLNPALQVSTQLSPDTLSIIKAIIFQWHYCPSKVFLFHNLCQFLSKYLLKINNRLLCWQGGCQPDLG